MKTIDKARKVTEVFGRIPLRYLQDGQGFDTSGKHLGAYTDNGEPVKVAAKPKADTKGDSKGEPAKPTADDAKGEAGA